MRDSIRPLLINSSTIPTANTTQKEKMSSSQWCFIEFDGAAKGNPGPAGAGALLRDGFGNVIVKVYEGLGRATNNEAEYRGLLLGMRTARERGYIDVYAKTDSQLVEKQVKGEWKTSQENMYNLCAEVFRLKNGFRLFDIQYHARELNFDADRLANLGVNLPCGEVVYEH